MAAARTTAAEVAAGPGHYALRRRWYKENRRMDGDSGAGSGRAQQEVASPQQGERQAAEAGTEAEAAPLLLLPSGGGGAAETVAAYRARRAWFHER
eukprot:SAG11_NODE_21636_length_421_cov_0.962733_1_plen_95_part_10